jgi:hypothetical protein
MIITGKLLCRRKEEWGLRAIWSPGESSIFFPVLLSPTFHGFGTSNKQNLVKWRDNLNKGSS